MADDEEYFNAYYKVWAEYNDERIREDICRVMGVTDKEWIKQIKVIINERRFDFDTLQDLEVTYEAETGIRRGGVEILLFYMFSSLTINDLMLFKAQAAKVVQDDYLKIIFTKYPHLKKGTNDE